MPSTLIAILLLLAWIAVAAPRWRWPLLLDLTAIGLYAAWPSAATLTLVGVQAAVRYVPELAREVALLLHLTSLAGWTLRATVFLLPGLRRYQANGAGGAAQGATIALTPAEALAPAPNAQVPSPIPLLTSEWLHALNHDSTAPVNDCHVHATACTSTRTPKRWIGTRKAG